MSELVSVVREIKEPLIGLGVGLGVLLGILYIGGGIWAVVGALIGGLMVAVPSVVIRVWWTLRQDKAAGY